MKFLDRFIRLFKKPKPKPEQKPEITQEQKLGIMLEDLVQLCKAIDDILKQKLNKTARKQFWRDFYKNDLVRKDVFEELLKTKTISDELLNGYMKVRGV
jgi:hypothetical protein